MSVLGPLERGRAEGKLALTAFEKISLEKLLDMEQEVATQLEAFQKEVKEKNWRIEYLDHLAKLSGEININNIEYQIMPWSILKGNYSIMIDIGMIFPTIKEIRLHQLTYSIQTDKMKYDGISVDFIKKEITHINDVFWNWEEGMEKDPEKLLEASETLKVLKWLIEEKNYVLGRDYDLTKYQRICEIIEKSLEKEQYVQIPISQADADKDVIHDAQKT
jgi:hypothetical protein